MVRGGYFKAAWNEKKVALNKVAPIYQGINEPDFDILDDYNRRYKCIPFEMPRFAKILVNFRHVWELFILATIVVHCFIILYTTVFTFNEPWETDTMMLLDCIFALDMTVRMIIEYWRGKRRVLYLILVLQYSLHQYFLDLITLIPFEYAGYYGLKYSPFADQAWGLFLVKLCLFNRFFRLRRAQPLFDCMEFEIISEKIIFLMKLAFTMFAVIQIIASAFYLTCGLTYLDWLLYRASAKVDGLSSNSSCYLSFRRRRAVFRNRHRLDEPPSPFELFVWTIDYIVTTITEIGFGQVSPFKPLEIVLALGTMVTGVITSGVVSSKLIDFRIEKDEARFDLFYRLKAVKAHYGLNPSCPQTFIASLNEYYTYLWNYREGVHEADLSRLPPSMQDDIMLDICQDMFIKSRLLQDIDKAFLSCMSKIVQVRLYNPEMILFKEYAHTGTMYYLLQGELLIRAAAKPDQIAGIVKPGSIIGELSLMFSYQASYQADTRGVCQFLVIEQEAFRNICEQHPYAYQKIKDNYAECINDFREHYDFYGKPPLMWAVMKEEEKNKPRDKRPRFIMRSTYGFNRIVHPDVVDDTVRSYFFETPTYDLPKNYLNDHTLCFHTCAKPPILDSEVAWIQLYNYFVLVSTYILGIILPLCYAYDSDREEDVACSIIGGYGILTSVLYITDIVVELLFATPTTGLYYQFWDGLRVKSRQATFYIDLICAIPFDTIVIFGIYSEPYMIPTIKTFFKFWKVLRFYEYLDNKKPLSLPFLRFWKVISLILVYLHYGSCVLYRAGQRTAGHPNWFDSYHFHAGDLAPRGHVIFRTGPYVYPLYFASAVITKAGYNNFRGQSPYEMIYISLFEISAYFVSGYFNAALASSLACAVRPALRYNQKLESVDQYLNHLSIGQKLKNRIFEHYRLQFQLNRGIDLGDQTYHLFDAPDYIAIDAVYFDLEVILEGIPLFTKGTPQIFERISKLMKKYLLPPNLIFVKKGEVRRHMYIILEGEVALIRRPFAKKIKHDIVITSTAHFGANDLFFGQPSKYEVHTLTYVQLYMLEYHEFLECFKDDELINHIITEEKKKFPPKEITGLGLSRETRASGSVVEIPSFIYFPKSAKEDKEFPHCTFKEYNTIYRVTPYNKYFKIFLMDKLIHPCGQFARGWICATSSLTLITLVLLFLETFMHYNNPNLKIIQYLLDLINMVDVYFKCHWAYYTKKNILICHPIKCAIHYIWDGMFIYDVVFCIPLELLVPLVDFPHTNFWGHGRGIGWYCKLKWCRLGQIYRWPNLFRILGWNINMRVWLYTTLYFMVTLCVCTIFGTISIYFACPIVPQAWKEGDGDKLPYCLPDTWATAVEGLDMSNYENRWIVTVYYVAQSFLSVGYGDMNPLKPDDSFETIFIISFSILGYIFLQYVTADITAAQVDTDEIRSNFVEQTRRLVELLIQENCPQKFLKNVQLHLKHVWSTSRGLQPKYLFNDLHPALENDLFSHVVGKHLDSVPILQNLNDTILRSLGKLLRREYFLQGERISRLGEMEPEMLIVVSGEVFIGDRDLNWKCTLTSGESFGESNMLYGTLRKYTAIAATNVEVFAVTANDFTVLLSMYSQLRARIKGILGAGTADVYERKIFDKTKCTDREALGAAEEKSFYMRKSVYLREYGINLHDPRDRELAFRDQLKPRCAWMGYIMGWGNNDYNLPGLYLATENPRWFKLLIHPNCFCSRVHEIVMIVLSFFSSAIALYEYVFGKHIASAITDDSSDVASTVVIEVGNLVEYVLYTQVLFRLITPFQVAGGSYCKEFPKIVLNYVVSIWFVIDMIVIIPEQFNDDLKLLRYLRLIYTYKVLFSFKNDVNISIFMYRLSISVTMFFTAAHILACAFYQVAAETSIADGELCPDLNTNTWLSVYTDSYLGSEAFKPKPEECYASRWYLRAIYFVVTTFTTCGYGDITPTTIKECTVVLLIIFIGVYGVNIIIGNISTGLTSLKKARRSFFYTIGLLVNHLRNVGLSAERKKLLFTYFNVLWKHFNGVYAHENFEILSLSIKGDALSLVFGEVVRRCKFFGSLGDMQFVRNVSLRFSHLMFLPGQFIINQDAYGDALYIVFKGSVAGYDISAGDENPEFLRKYECFDAFGKVPALFHGAAYSKAYRAEVPTELLVLKQKDIQLLCAFFPRWKAYLVKYIDLNYPQLLGELTSIFKTHEEEETKLLNDDNPIYKK